uniref:Uncharacterized protein n=1 Tax=Anguilla anguilla TaxID=7936 RepID=A0A0E9XJV8_ANGAN
MWVQAVQHSHETREQLMIPNGRGENTSENYLHYNWLYAMSHRLNRTVSPNQGPIKPHSHHHYFTGILPRSGLPRSAIVFFFQGQMHISWSAGFPWGSQRGFP